MDSKTEPGVRLESLQFSRTPLTHLMLRIFLFLVFVEGFHCICEASTLPVGPIDFGSIADYDSNFKEVSSSNGIERNPAGYLQILGVPTAIAVLDTSSTGGVNGQGGTGGSNADNAFSNFTISADVASSVVGGIGVGFLLRLNNAEAGGYFASIHGSGPSAVAFDIGESASLLSRGNRIYSVTVPLAGLTAAANTFYHFEVTVSDGRFLFDFGSGAATASFTDPTLTATVGQVGIVLDTFSPSAATRLDNFAIVPEPQTGLLLLGFATGWFTLRRRYKT